MNGSFSALLTASRKIYYNRHLKKIFDITLSLFLLIVSMPVTLLTALLIKLSSSGPVFYSQTRVGYNEKTVSHTQVPFHDPQRRKGHRGRMGQQERLQGHPYRENNPQDKDR